MSAAPKSRLVKFTQSQLRVLDIARAEIFHGIAKNVPRSADALLFRRMAHGLDDRDIGNRFLPTKVETPQDLNERLHWRFHMRSLRKLNQIAKAASSYQTPKK